MSVRIEKLIAEYPDMVRDRKCLAYQIAHFRGLSAEEVIESMYTPRQDGERVQTSSLSDKTAQIALNYESRMERLNREWYEHLEKQLLELTDELNFFEGALRALPVEMADVMWDLVVEQMKWDAVEQKYCISHTTVYRMRKKAIVLLDKIYKQHDTAAASYLLG